MAGPTSFSVYTLPEKIKGISDTLCADIAILRLLKEKGRMELGRGGDGFEFLVRVRAGNVGGAASDFATGSAQTVRPTEKCAATYAAYLWKLQQSMLQLDRNKYADNTAKLAEQQDEDLNAIMQEALERIGRHCYGDAATYLTGDVAGVQLITGLEALILASGTYFGLARATYTSLNSQVVACANPSSWDSADQSNLVRDMETLWNQCSGGKSAAADGISKDIAGSKVEPDFIITTQTRFEVFSKVVSSQQQYVGETSDPAKKRAFHGVALEWDTFCTANRLYMGNSKHLALRVVGPQLLRKLAAVDTVNPVAHVDVIGAQCELYSRNPRYLGKLTITGS